VTAPLPPDAVERIDEVSDRFEAAWKAGGQPRIEDYLGATAGPEREAAWASSIEPGSFGRTAWWPSR
jgi:hypothetical protein